MIYFMYQKPQITLNELAGKLHLSRAGVRYNLEQLKQKGIVSRKGSNKKGIWVVKEEYVDDNK